MPGQPHDVQSCWVLKRMQDADQLWECFRTKLEAGYPFAQEYLSIWPSEDDGQQKKAQECAHEE